eukprot:NODE_8826_length_499_cov_74.937778_g7757_i0.p4 GENE.NODE_8826_length_499_cov_74.937778_g7757_i0~~NODE_8826_length_499_cov_74.937778_g7757_i0.p4  ORF type:complete len:86 (+),score=13.14 NODE_8826_length_499_cov_74.937778_g7757_i0:158-415(+)
MSLGQKAIQGPGAVAPVAPPNRLFGAISAVFGFAKSLGAPALWLGMMLFVPSIYGENPSLYAAYNTFYDVLGCLRVEASTSSTSS